MLALVDLTDRADDRFKGYSLGMKQRLGVAAALLGDPELIVLDEPTNGLDPPQIAEMREVMKRYADTGRTVVVSSHLLAEVEQTCSHVVVMHKGQLVAAGIMGGFVYGVVSYLAPSSALMLVPAIGAGLVVGGVTYFAAIYALRVPGISELMARLPVLRRFA